MSTQKPTTKKKAATNKPAKQTTNHQFVMRGDLVFLNDKYYKKYLRTGNVSFSLCKVKLTKKGFRWEIEDLKGKQGYETPHEACIDFLNSPYFDTKPVVMEKK
jgi:hypothetical protein